MSTDIYALYDFGGKTKEEWETEHEYWEIPPLTPSASARREQAEARRIEDIHAQQKIQSERDGLRQQARIHLPSLIERDGNLCQRCGTQEKLTVDHVVALANGGSNEIDNLQLLCNRCNASKGAR